MVSRKEIALREEKLIEFLSKMPLPCKVSPKSGNMNYLELANGSEKGVIIPVYSHIANQDQKIRNLPLMYYSDLSSKPAFIFYKDGENFFRSAAQENSFKSRNRLALKHYSMDEVNRMILLSPEERLIRNIRPYLQYYQPKSERLEEMLVTFKFKPVEYDYSHIPSDSSFIPTNKSSERIFLWSEKYERGTDSSLVIKDGYVKKST